MSMSSLFPSLSGVEAFELLRLAYSLIRARFLALIKTSEEPIPLLRTFAKPFAAFTPPTDRRACVPAVPIEDLVRPLPTLDPEDPLAARCAPSLAITFDLEMRGLRCTLCMRLTELTSLGAT